MTVRLMEKRPLPELPTLRRRSVWDFKAACPANADCWIPQLAIDDSSALLSYFLLELMLRHVSRKISL
nr:hypothetical protein Iba_scaffold18056CG0010 [Ipomoea batatas]